MSCTNPNCNPGCGCNNCCPPVPPPVPPTPPICIGEDCVEHYDGKCVLYTGPAISCIGIQTNDNINNIIQTLATRICDCCGTTKCISPFKLFFERFKRMYDILFAADPTLAFFNLFKQYLENGMVVKKCQYCCPDVFMYGLCTDSRRGTFVFNYSQFPLTIETPCENCWNDYTSCAATLLTKFDTTLNGAIPALTVNTLHEFGGINNVSAVCDLITIFTNNFTTEQITDIMQAINDNGLVLTCDLEKGNVVIGGIEVINGYIQDVIIKPKK